MSGHGDNSGAGGTGVAGRGGKRRRKGGRGRGKVNLATTNDIDQVNPDPQTAAPTESSSPAAPTPISKINPSPVVELVTNLTTPPAQKSTSSSLPVAAKPARPTSPVGASTVPVTGVDESQEGTTEAITGESPSTPKPPGKKKNSRKGKGKGKGKVALVNVGETTENIQVDASLSACGNEAVSGAIPGPATCMSNTSPGPVSGSSSTPAPVPTKPGASGSTPSKSKTKPKSNQPPEPQSQYHHYIPRLVLREFASAEHRAAEPRNPFVNVYSMENAIITPTRVARCYGYVDMYQDISAKDAMHIEKSLAHLEREASGIVSRIKKAVEQGETSIKLTRVERNQVRKFLFVMKYRTPLFWAKYNRSVEEYQHIDRDAVLEFMREKNFTRPVEVWLHTLKTILDTPIDPDKNWEDTLTANCFIHDALWYLMNTNESFMAFCTPQDPATDEFVVSESAFGIHEGPTDDHGSLTEVTGRKKTTKRNTKVDLSSEIRALDQDYGWYTEYHKMAPFSPKLLLVLRSNFLRDEDSKKTLRKMAEIGSPGSHQWKKPSLFDHLHLDPPQPSYVNKPTISDGTPTVKYSNQDVFTFTLHKLSHKDVVLFNSIIFSNVRRNLTWHSDQAMKVALEEYLKEETFLLPAELAFFSGKEDIEKMWEVERRQQLQRLLAILKGHQGAQGIQIPTPPVSSHVKGLSEFEERFSKNPLSQGYFKIGGTAMNWMRDFFQASQVTKMRTMVSNALPQGPHRLSYRNGVSRANMAFFATLSPIVIYLHISTWMVLQANRQAGPGANMEAIMANQILHNEDENPHDAVAKVSKKLPREHLSKLMLQSSLRRVSQREDFLRNRDTTEYSCFSTFGGLTSSFLIESTPWYDPSIDTFLLNPYRSIEVPREMFLREMMVRFQVKRAGIIRAKWGPEIDEFVWKWLYEGPEDD